MPASQPTVAITGATGFIGRHLGEWMAARGWTVRALSLRGGPGAIRPDALAAGLEGSDALVHLAARVHVMGDGPGAAAAAYRETNVDLSRALLAAAAQAGVPTLVLASSVKAVGKASTAPWTEATPPRPADPYGASKLEAEALFAGAAARRAIALRLPLVYGPGVRANMLRLFQLVDRGLPLPFGGLDNRRSLLYVGNVAQAIEAAIAAPDLPSGAYFVRDGRDVSTPELVRLIAEALGRPARLLPFPATLLGLAGRLGDRLSGILPLPITTAGVARLTGSLQVDDTEFRARSGFRPPFTIEQGLARTAEWFRSLGTNRTGVRT